MKTLNVSISELEFQKFGLQEEKLAFSDLVDIINNELTRQRLEKSVELAKQYGLSEISMEDISNEVNEVRK